LTTSFCGSGDALFTSIAIQPDGKIVLGGSPYNSATGQDFALERYFGS
jgi:hypothetical protein